MVFLAETTRQGAGFHTWRFRYCLHWRLCFDHQLAFLIEYVATLAKMLRVIGGFLFKATRQSAGLLFGGVDMAYICVLCSDRQHYT